MLAKTIVRLHVEIPRLDDVLSEGLCVPLAAKGTKWSAKCLGKQGKAVGVYAIHCNGALKYVGKTDGPTMDFSTRLRREFQETAASGKHVYPKLAALINPADITVTLFPQEQVERLVTTEGFTLALWQKIEILETAMIQVLNPEWQRHHVNRVAKFIHEHFSPETISEWLKSRSQTGSQ